MLPFDSVVWGVPVSVQASSHSKAKWKAIVAEAARPARSGPLLADELSQW
jgi:hypothetical protein